MICTILFYERRTMSSPNKQLIILRQHCGFRLPSAHMAVGGQRFRFFVRLIFPVYCINQLVTIHINHLLGM